MIIILAALEDLDERGQVHAEWHGAVASELGETRVLEFDRDECNMRVIHGLKLQPFFVTFEIGVSHKFFDG